MEAECFTVSYSIKIRQYKFKQLLIIQTECCTILFPLMSKREQKQCKNKKKSFYEE